ncbi:carbon-nitrogen hydrolase family protein [Hyphomicrobium sp. LHD-15]|uniref:carbon-nitrogen hydrolase family protein n=1 Tax=Hyphomicrobium sp. LHD-15 TaxID=3072142 RepID=UPI00280EE911|nr:carbon-nitrogen hydrolase family protein [Hyphomicrobium sp. LHD-15]MDQ8699904.1 carbon-nitrogen hydrolase family protein [Hyphomicrobium sp. LHD-15]
MSETDPTEALRVALVQMCSGRDVARNLSDATALIREAASGGAQYVQTPEVTNLMELERERLFAAAEPENSDAALRHFKALAKELSIWLHLGSLVVKVSDTKLANRAFLISPAGEVAARYDKIHMFDVDLPNGEVYRESTNYEPGTQAVVADLPWGKLGFSICYDLRFPYLYRALAQAGASFIAVPAAFTRLTGEAHWVTLLRARAIETQCFVFAAGQGGLHEHGRETFGHSLIVSPWGEVLAEGGVHPSVIFADVDLGQIADVRARVPSLRHDRKFEVVEAGAKAATEVTS